MVVFTYNLKSDLHFLLEFFVSSFSAAALPADPDFAMARLNMVQCQLYPSGIITDRVLEAYNTTPREAFVPKNMRGICYQDECLQIGKRRMLQPLAHALMMEHVGFTGSEHVLDIGGLTGYSAAIARFVGASVIALEEDAGALAQAQNVWEVLGLTNITPVLGNHQEGASAQGPYDVIIINGAVDTIPETFLAQLKPNGKLACIKGNQGGVGKITVFERDAQGVCDHKIYQDIFADYLPGFTPPEKFVF